MENKLNFSLTQLEYVLAVQKHGHFSKAAEACYVTQPTLSMQIQKLEESLGIVIFDRSKKPTLVTDAGSRLVEQMQAIVHEARKLDAIRQSSLGGVMTGEISLGIIPTIAPYLLPLLLPVLERDCPGIQFRIFEMQTHRIIEALKDDEIDAGLLATPLGNPKIEERAIFWEPFTVLCQKGHVLSKNKKVKYSALDASDIWLLEEGHCLRNQVLDVCSIKNRKPVQRQFQFESGSLETLKNLVNSFGGYTLLPALATESLGKDVVLVPFERPIPAREIGMVSQRRHHKRELLDGLERAVLAAVPETLRKLRPKDLDVLPIDAD
jgi:LysR family hydrogen peroxide-inducible transcriptional activator